MQLLDWNLFHQVQLYVWFLKLFDLFLELSLPVKHKSATNTPNIQLDFIIWYVLTLPSGRITPLVNIKHPKGLASVVVTIQ